MAKKKGGRKRSGTKKKSKKTSDEQPPEPAEEEPVKEEAQVPEEEEPALSDAVAEVIGDSKKEKKDTRKIPKKYKAALLKYTADGYDVSVLEDLMENASVKKIREGFREFEAGLEKAKEIRNALEEMDLEGMEDEVQEIEDILRNPGRYQEAEEKLDLIRLKQRAAEIRKELDGMVLPAMKERVEAMKARLENLDELDSIEADMVELRRDYKEAYAEEGVKAHIATEAPGAGKPAPGGRRRPMVVRDIFLLYKDGRFISHHTNRVVSKEQQKMLFADLKTGRNFLRSPKYVPKKLNVIPVENRNILVQSGNFTVVIMVTEGSVDPFTERIISKVLTLMEKEDALELKAWNGEVSSLKSSGKYMQALLFACMKLSKKKAGGS